MTDPNATQNQLPPTGPMTAGGAAATASQSLTPLGAGIAAASAGAAQGTVVIDSTTAATLVGALTDIANRVGHLVDDSAVLDQPLQFGQNWVGALMNERLRGAAAGQQTSIGPVLAQFQAMLEQATQTVQLAANAYAQAEANNSAGLRSAAHRGAGR